MKEDDDPFDVMSSTKVDDLNNRMADIFGETSDPPSSTPTNSTLNEPSDSSLRLFTATVFLSVPNRLPITKFGLVLFKKLRTSILFYDNSKKNFIRTECEESSFVFDKSTLSVKIESTIEGSPCQLFVTFIELSDFLRFSTLLLFHTMSFPTFILHSGNGEHIIQDCTVLYDIVKIDINEDESELWESENDIKCKLSESRIGRNSLYHNFIGLSKGAHLLVKTSNDLILEVKIRKIKWPGIKKTITPETFTNTGDVKQANFETEKEGMFGSIFQENTIDENTTKFSGVEDKIDTKCKESQPHKKDSQIQTENNYDLNEIIKQLKTTGLEQFLVEMKSEIMETQNKILARLDLQNKWLEKLWNEEPRRY